MLDNLENLFFGFFDLLESGWNYLSVDLVKKYEFNYKEALLNHVKFFETKMKQYNPITVFIGAIVMLMTILYVMKLLKRFWRKINSKEKIMDWIAWFLMLLPVTKNKMNKARADIGELVKNSFKANRFKRIDFIDKGLNENTIIGKLKSWQEIDRESYGKGNETLISGTLYTNEYDLECLCGQVAGMYSYENLLHPDIFVSARYIESELVKMGVELFHGTKVGACGITTTGGTESILLAMMSYRNVGLKKGIKWPEIIIPITAHAAFWKAADMFRFKLVVVDYETETYGVDIAKVKRAINSNTVAIVGSFPNFPHGAMDNIEALSELAVKYNIGLHVDACLGGLLACFYSHSNANIKIPKFDFLLPGVTTISADLHKYGLAPKGVSYLLYRSKELRKNQYFIYPRWMGGTYPSPTIAGSRSPALMVCAYAIMLKKGKNFYANQARDIHEAIGKIKEFTKKNFKELRVIGDPLICVVAFTGAKSNIIYDLMCKKGWHLNLINNPIGFSIAITIANLTMVNKRLCSDLKECYETVMGSNQVKESEHCKLYGMSVNMPETIVKQNLDALVDAMLD